MITFTFFSQKNDLYLYPLYYVIESGCVENLKAVEHLFRQQDDLNINLKIPKSTSNYSPDVNVKYDGQNVLHFLIDTLTNENCEKLFVMIKIVVAYGCNVNWPNREGKTPFYLILEKLPKLNCADEILDFFLDHSNVDFYSYRSDEIIEMVLNRKLKYQIPKTNDDDTISFDHMISLLIDWKINEFETNFLIFKAALTGSAIYADRCAMLLELATNLKIINIVDLLIDFSDDINLISEYSRFKIPPAFLACKNGTPEIFKLFLMHPDIQFHYEVDGKLKTLFHHFFDDLKSRSYISVRNQKAKESLTMSLQRDKCFELLINHPKCTTDVINTNDENGHPPIYYSVRFKNDNVTLQLLRKGAYIGSVIDRIRRSLLEEFLNGCVTTNQRFQDDEDFELEINYKFLIPPGKGLKKKTKMNSENSKMITSVIEKSNEANCLMKPASDYYYEEVEPLNQLAQNHELKHLMAHPVITTFILLKWSKLSFLIYLNMMLLLTYMISFVTFMILCQSIPEEERYSSVSFITFQVLSLLSLLMLFLREYVQCMLSFRQYITNPTNWIDICLMVPSLVILLFEDKIPDHASRILRSFIILLAAAEYFSLLGMVPIMSVSIYTKMFKRVCITFVKSLSFYSMMIIAFAFSFYTLHGDKFAKDLQKNEWDTSTNNVPVTNATRNERFNNFYYVGVSIVKAFVMLTGEMDSSYIYLEEFSYAFLFLLYIFLVTIVLYNLLNALAVSDTQEIKRDAKLIDLNQRISTMHESEEAIFKRTSRTGDWLKKVVSMFPKTLPGGKIMIKPNRSNRVFNMHTEPIILNDFLPRHFQFLKKAVKLNHEVIVELQKLLVNRHEEQRLADVRRLKDNRNRKLTNDIIEMRKVITEIHEQLIKLRN